LQQVKKKIKQISDADDKEYKPNIGSGKDNSDKSMRKSKRAMKEVILLTLVKLLKSNTSGKSYRGTSQVEHLIDPVLFWASIQFLYAEF